MENSMLIYVTVIVRVLLVYSEAVDYKTEQFFRMNHRQIWDYDRFTESEDDMIKNTRRLSSQCESWMELNDTNQHHVDRILMHIEEKPITTLNHLFHEKINHRITIATSAGQANE